MTHSHSQLLSKPLGEFLHRTIQWLPGLKRACRMLPSPGVEGFAPRISSFLQLYSKPLRGMMPLGHCQAILRTLRPPLGAPTSGGNFHPDDASVASVQLSSPAKSTARRRHSTALPTAAVKKSRSVDLDLETIMSTLQFSTETLSSVVAHVGPCPALPTTAPDPLPAVLSSGTSDCCPSRLRADPGLPSCSSPWVFCSSVSLWGHYVHSSSDLRL